MIRSRGISGMIASAVLALAAFAAPVCAAAQVADSSSVHCSAMNFKPGQLIAPGVLLAAGAGIHFASHETIDVKVNGWTSSWKEDNEPLRIDDYARFVPGVMSIGLGIIGARTDNNLGDRIIEDFWAYGSYLAAVYMVKALVDSPRPGLADSKSFPSGHAGFAFTGAELVRMQYGWGWGTGAYAVAVGVSAVRLYNNAHWLSDILFGAGCGILCAHVGGWLLAPTRHLLGLDRTEADNGPGAITFTTRIDPLTGALCPALAVKF